MDSLGEILEKKFSERDASLKEIVRSEFKAQEEKQKESTICMSKASESQVSGVLNKLSMIVVAGECDIQGIEFAKFDWGTQYEVQGTARALEHLCGGLTAAGVLLEVEGGFQAIDTHAYPGLLNFDDDRVGKISGGTDIVITPYRVDPISLASEIAVIIELKTKSNVEKNGGLGAIEFNRQAILELCSARCLSHQPGILVVLTDLNSGAIAFETVFSNDSQNYFIHKISLRHDQVCPFIAHFLSSCSVPNPSFVPSANSDDPREAGVVHFKRAKLSDIGTSLAWEHMEEMKEETEPWSRERALVVRDFFQSLNLERTPTVIEYSTMYT